MGEEAINKILRRIKDETEDILDGESFNVARITKGKLSGVIDFTCFDKGTLKLVKVCLDEISKKELESLLYFNDSQISTSTILQIDFWKRQGRKPFYRAKLFYNQPNQYISEGLKRLVK